MARGAPRVSSMVKIEHFSDDPNQEHHHQAQQSPSSGPKINANAINKPGASAGSAYVPQSTWRNPVTNNTTGSRGLVQSAKRYGERLSESFDNKLMFHIQGISETLAYSDHSRIEHISS